MATPIIKNELRIEVLSACVALLIVGGCTAGIESRPAARSEALTGLVYHLPATQLSVTVRYRLVDCKPTVLVERVEATLGAVADRRPSTTFTIDNTAMSSFLKAMDLADLTFKDGLITKISYRPTKIELPKTEGSASADQGNTKLPPDDTSQQPSATPSAVLYRVDSLDQIARSKGEDNGNREAGVCNAASRDLLDRQALLLESRQRLRDDRIGKLQSANGENATKVVQAIGKIEKNLESVQTALDKLDLAPLRLQYARIWVPSLASPEIRIQIPIATMAKWFDLARLDVVSIRASAQVRLGLAVDAATSDEFQSNESPGLYYRVPANKLVHIQVGETPEDTVERPLPMLQFGPIASVQMKNGVLQDNQFGLTFSQTGELSGFDYAESLSRVEAVATQANDLVDDATKSQVARLKRGEGLYKARRELLEALGGSSPDSSDEPK